MIFCLHLNLCMFGLFTNLLLFTQGLHTYNQVGGFVIHCKHLNEICIIPFNYINIRTNCYEIHLLQSFKFSPCYFLTICSEFEILLICLFYFSFFWFFLIFSIAFCFIMLKYYFKITT